MEVGQLASRRVWEAACQAQEKYFSFKKMNVQRYGVLNVILSCYDKTYARERKQNVKLHNYFNAKHQKIICIVLKMNGINMIHD